MRNAEIGRYIVGTGFCMISALIYGVNYAVAGSLAQGLGKWETDLGRVGTAVKDNSSDFLTALSVLALMIGIAFIVAAEIKSRPPKSSPEVLISGRNP